MTKYSAWMRFYGKDASGKIFAFPWQTMGADGVPYEDARDACQRMLDAQTDRISKVVLPVGITPYEAAGVE
jgi:hypothetical protein